MDDDGVCRRRAREPIELLHPFAIVADQSLDGDAGDVGAGSGKAQALARGDGRPGDGERYHDDSEDPPEGELTPQPAAIDDHVGIE